MTRRVQRRTQEPVRQSVQRQGQAVQRQGQGQKLTRRHVLTLLGMGGGSAAVLHATRALGLTADPSRPSPYGRFVSPLPGDGPRPRVAILGAGLGGLCAAYELEQAGYEVQILEASHRIGGRSFTVRRGTVIDELGNRQVCDFDDDPFLYLNAGPARIPAMHHRLMGYCREFGVPLEPFVNNNYNAWVVDKAINDGVRARQRDVTADARGFVAELAAKGVSAAQLDSPMSDQDLEKLRDYIRDYGDLRHTDMRYVGTERTGFTTDGMLGPVELKTPGTLQEITNSRFRSLGMMFSQSEFQAPTVMQPIGGMDRIVDAFLGRLQQAPITRARVVEIRNGSTGVEIRYEKDDQLMTLAADYCLNSIPGHLMAGVKHNLSPEYTALIGKIKRSSLTKIGFQMSRRFWEDEGIFGGISWTDDKIQQVWYPTHGPQRQKGVVTGAYVFFQHHNQEFGRMSHAERLRSAAEAGEALHPGQYARHIETGVSVVWHRMNHMLGCGHSVGSPADPFDNESDAIRAKLLAGDGRHFMLGDQVSKHAGWQEGALAVTENVLQTIAARESATRLAQQG